MRRIIHSSYNFIISVVITALLLTGAVPSFGWESFAVEDAKAGQSQPVATEESQQTATDADGENARVVLPAINIDQTDAPRVYGTSVIVTDMNTGTVLYEKNADKVRQPASVTKILTCLVVLENLPLDQEIVVPEGIELNGSVMGVMPGEKLTVEQLLYGLMLPSGNDAAEVLAIATAGSIDEFSKMMNARAKECGAMHTDFRNPNGLNEDPDRLNYTTARDLALISREAMANQEFRKIVGTAKYTVPATNMSEERELKNSNVCLYREKKTKINGKKVPFKYEGCTGIKTGYTSDAGNCFVGSAERNGTEILVVSLNCKGLAQRYKDGIIMWDYALGKYETYQVLQADQEVGKSRVWGGKKRSVKLKITRELAVTIEKGTAPEQDFTTEFKLTDSKVEAPIQKGQKMGQALIFNSKGRLVGAEDIYAAASVGVGGPLSRFGIADEDLPLAGGIAGGIVLLIVILCIRTHVRRKRARSRQQEEIAGQLQTMRTAGVGLTASELSDLTGEEIIQPIPKGPARISDEELTAWTSTEQRTEEERYSGSRFGGRSVKGGYDRNTPLSDEELFDMLGATETTDINQPRRHGKLTPEEMEEVMQADRGKDQADV